MTLHDKRTQRTHKQWRRRKFFLSPKYIIWDPGESKKQTDAIVASGMSFRSGLVLTKSSNSTVCQKYGKNTVLTVANPTLKTKKKKKRDMRALDHSKETPAPGEGGMTLHDKRTQRTHKQWRRRIFFCPQMYHLGPWWKQEANGCHPCIRNEFSKWVGTHEILQLNGMSKIWQKHGFDRSQPYPKNLKKKKKKRDMRALDHSEETVAHGGGGGDIA